MIGAAALEWEKIKGRIPLHQIYIFDTKEKTDPRNTDRFIWSHGKLKRLLRTWKSLPVTSDLQVFRHWHRLCGPGVG